MVRRATRPGTLEGQRVESQARDGAAQSAGTLESRGPDPASPRERTVAGRVDAGFDAELRLVEEVDSLGPGKNVLSHRTLYRVETGTYETLQLVDGPAVEEPVETVDPYDPYNTGSFDQWEKPRRK